MYILTTEDLKKINGGDNSEYIMPAYAGTAIATTLVLRWAEATWFNSIMVGITAPAAMASVAYTSMILYAVVRDKINPQDCAIPN